jgi:hypothetical protein
MSIEFNNVPGINDKNDMERMFSLLWRQNPVCIGWKMFERYEYL